MLLLESELLSLHNPHKSSILARFFKTGPGEYGEGDKFLGIQIPDLRALVRRYLAECDFDAIDSLLASPWHEVRMAWALALVLLYERDGKRCKKEWSDPILTLRPYLDFYLSHTKSLNNWDLVDLSAPKVFGEYLRLLPDAEATRILDTLAKSDLLWERRIAIVWAFAFLKAWVSHHTLRLAEKLLHDKESLMHKAVGWMLRELGKRCSREELLAFVDAHVDQMPRTMLRYSLEHLPKDQYREYLERGK